MPRGCRVLHLKIRRPSALRLSLVLWRPARTTATIISSVVWPGEEKCLAKGRSAFFETDLRCSQNLSPSLRPVSPTYDRVHARQVMIYTRLLVVHENLCRMVRGPPGVLIWEAGLVWAQVLLRGRRQGKVPIGSSSVFAPDWRLLLTKESRRSHSYLTYTSSHPVRCKNSVPYSQFLRLKRICSDENDYKTKSKEMASFFLQRDYPLAVVDRALQHVDTIPRDTALRPPKRRTIQQRSHPLNFNIQPLQPPCKEHPIKKLRPFKIWPWN